MAGKKTLPKGVTKNPEKEAPKPEPKKVIEAPARYRGQNKAEMNASIMKAETTMDKLRARLQRFKNTIDRSAIRKDPEITNLIAELVDWQKSFATAAEPDNTGSTANTKAKAGRAAKK